MGRSINIEPATFDQIYDIPLPDGMFMFDPKKQFKDEEWLKEHSRCVSKDGLTLAVFGVVPIWPGVGHAFAYIHKDASKYPITLITAGREMVELAFLEKELWRLQATVDENFDAGIRYLYALGFYLEGVMKQYGPDKSDHLMMARTVS
jgi:hypothetical protein